jgi:small subunit ribosomal protein S6
MNPRTYEAALVLDTGLDPDKLKEQLEKFEEQILHFGGLIRRWDPWGKKRLAYEIQHKQYGYYAVVVFDVEPSAIKSLDRYLRLNSYLLRHLIVQMNRHRIPPVEPTAQLRLEPDKLTEETAGTPVSESEESAGENPEEQAEESLTPDVEGDTRSETSGESQPIRPAPRS